MVHSYYNSPNNEIHELNNSDTKILYNLYNILSFCLMNVMPWIYNLVEEKDLAVYIIII